MNTHFNRKTVCKPLLENINLDEYKQKILNKEIINTKNTLHQNYADFHQNDTNNQDNHTIFESHKKNSHQNYANFHQNDTNIPDNHTILQKKDSKKVYECKYCKKIYSRKDSLNRHHKKCQEKDTDEKCKQDMMDLVNKLNEQLDLKDKQMDEQLEQKDKQLKKRDLQINQELKKRDLQLHDEIKKRDKQIYDQTKQINELIKKTGITQNIQNIQNNIKILAYKDTDLSHLTDKDYLSCLNRSNMCIPNLIKRIHFDPRKPENNNVYISNIKNKYIMIYDGIKWNLQNQNETIDDLIDTNEFVLEQKLEEWVVNGKDYPEIMKKFNRYLEKKETDEVLNKIKEEIKLILFNNRKTIEI
jgi:hypothetical protein